MVSEVSSIGALAAVAGGAASFLSPCVLPLVPGYLSYTASSRPDTARGLRARLAAALIGLPFIAGFSTVFVLLGIGASVISRLLIAHKRPVEIAGGFLIILFGILATGWVRVPLFGREFRFHPALTPQRRILGGYLLGLAFAAGWTPCIGPILGAIMTLGATGASGSATLLMIFYTAGLGIPFLLAGALMDGLMVRLRPLAHAGAWIQRISGLLLILIGAAIASGELTSITAWLLTQFPVFSRIG